MRRRAAVVCNQETVSQQNNQPKRTTIMFMQLVSGTVQTAEWLRKHGWAIEIECACGMAEGTLEQRVDGCMGGNPENGTAEEIKTLLSFVNPTTNEEVLGKTTLFYDGEEVGSEGF